MGQTSEHSRLIAAAANAALLPLNCQRAGRSRIWYSDQRFWVISVEFQPSGWSKGTYLNIGTRWLWSPQSGIDLSYRPVDFIPFESTEQFNPLVVDLAARAAQEVQVLRGRFRTLANIREFLDQRPHLQSWPCFHAAVAAGLARDITGALKLFQRLAEWPTHGYDWEQGLKLRGKELARLANDSESFRREVQRTIDLARKHLKLPPDPRSLENIDCDHGA